MTATISSQSTLESTACPLYPSYIGPVSSASSNSTGVSSTTGNAYSTATRGATPTEISSSTRESFVIFEKQPRQEYAMEEVLMTFGDMTRKKEDIVVDASDLEAEAANDSCQRYANSPLESFESSI